MKIVCVQSKITPFLVISRNQRQPSKHDPCLRPSRTVVRCWPDITAHASHGDVVGEAGLYQRLPQARTMWRYSVHCVFAFQLGKLEVV